MSKTPYNLIDYTGKRKGSWTAIRYEGRGRWRVKCKCGREKSIAAGNWRSGAGTKTCACQPKKPNYNQLPVGEASFNLLYSSYITKARKRVIKFELTRESFKAITKKECFYCGLAPSASRCTQTGTPYIYTGVDRVDSSQGYSDNNVVPCCTLCNRSKSDLPLSDWLYWLQRVSERML